jgi:uncharacterized damage-inducible protein DinB
MANSPALDPRYPIGKFQYIPFENVSARQAAIAEIRGLPALLRRAVEGLSEEQLDSPYRDGGWTIRQLVHHIADSHMNAFLRFRLALTEDKPLIKPYDENEWAKLPDAALPIDSSLGIVEHLHHRWTVMLELLPEAAFARELVHPHSGEMTLDKLLQIYAWHGRHHVAHIEQAQQKSV